MNTMNRRRTQLAVVAVTALAVFAVAAVMLLAGGNPAQATTASLAPDDAVGISQPPPDRSSDMPPPPPTSPSPTPTPPPTPEPCPGEAAHLVDSGHIALFDVYWNPEEGELTNNPCPPTVSRDSASGDDTRSPSSIDIDETIIHIPNSAKIDLSDSTTYTQARYPDLWAADDGDDIVWRLPGCPPDGAADSDLCISFSAFLLNAAQWDGNIVYHVDHVHQIDIDKQDPRYTLAYDAPDDGGTDEREPIWDSSDARVSQMPVEPGGYERPMWFFTSRGTYEFQVHTTGNPEQDTANLGDLNPVSKDASVNSDVREYTIHVGAEADLGVEVTAEAADSSDNALDPGENVTITVTASTAGPDQAPDTEVNVSLPSGLKPPVDGEPYPYQATKGTYVDGVWTIGSMCNPLRPTIKAKPATATEPATKAVPECPQEATLTLTAEVGSNTRGQEMTVEATIEAEETLTITETEGDVDTPREYSVPVVDPNEVNDTAQATVTVAEIANVDPMFHVIRSVPENSPAGTILGDPIGVKEPDSGDTLTFSMSGNGAENFTHRVLERSNGAARVQIEVAQGADLDYELNDSFHICISVSDGKDDEGNLDDSIDSMIYIWVMVTDVADGISRVVPENSAGGVLVGDPVAVDLGSNAGTPTYALSGTGHRKFKVAAVAGGAQISVSNGVTINYEGRQIYRLTLQATDGTNSQSVAVKINVQDDPHERMSVSLKADRTTQTVLGNVIFTAKVRNSPVASSNLRYSWGEINVPPGDGKYGNVDSLTQEVSYTQVGQRKYSMTVVADRNGHTVQRATSPHVTITWTDTTD